MDRLVLFAKAPREGHAKTRLVPPLTAGQALALYRAFLADQGRFLSSFAPGRQAELCMDEPWPGARALVANVTRLTTQGPGDLGERLMRCFERSAREGAGRTVVMGADSPTLPASHVDAAFEALASGADAVLSPAFDGGYVLIGTSRPLPVLFRDIPWSGGDVTQTTRERARDAALRLEGLAPWYDVDVVEDLRRLRRDLATPAAERRAPATARVLATIPD